MSDLQKKIASAVQELYLEKGIEGVSMRKVAEKDTGNLGDTSTLADPSVVDSLIAERG